MERERLDKGNFLTEMNSQEKIGLEELVGGGGDYIFLRINVDC